MVNSLTPDLYIVTSINLLILIASAMCRLDEAAILDTVSSLMPRYL